MTQKPKRKVWLIYRPVLGYEESQIPLAVCLTKQEAEDAVDRARKKVSNLIKKLPHRPQYEALDPLDMSAEWEKYYSDLQMALKKFVWPFSMNLESDFIDDENSPEQVYQIKELPLCGKPIEEEK